MGPSGKIYIGQSQNVILRLADHIRNLRKNKHPNIHLQRAWKQCAGVGFVFEPLLFCEVEELTLFEQVAIDSIAIGMKYNIAVCADAPMRGRRHSRESIAKMSANHKGYKMSAEHIAKLAASNRGRKRSSETLAKMCAAKRDPVAREKMSVIMRGRTHSQEARDKMSASKKGKRLSQDHIDKRSAAQRGAKRSLETRGRIAASKRGKKYTHRTISHVMLDN